MKSPRDFILCSLFYRICLSIVCFLWVKLGLMSIERRSVGFIGYIVLKSRQRDKTDTVLKAVFLSLQLIDLALTLVAARYGYPELNPFVKASLSSFYLTVVFKFFIPVLISWFVPGRWLVPAILLLCGVVGWNAKELIMLAF